MKVDNCLGSKEVQGEVLLDISSRQGRKVSLNQSMKQGYKNTPHGMIPEDWDIRELGEFISAFSGGTPDRNTKEYFDGKIPWIKSGELNKGVINETEEHISDSGLQNSSAKVVNEGTLLLALYGATAGITAFSGIKAAINQAVLAIIPNEEVFDKRFLNNWFKLYKRSIILAYCQGGQPNLNAGIVKALIVKTPPVFEQRAIVALLTMWDEAIETITKLISQKELRKKWFMQQLLTGKKRLPGFQGEWKEARLKDIFSEIDTYNDGDIHPIMTISARSGFVSQQDKFDRVIAGDSLKKYTLIKKGDFAYNKGNSKLYEMGCIYQLEEQNSALVPFVYICFRPKATIHATFYKHWFLGHGLDRQLKKIITSGARGDGLLNVNPNDFFSLNVPFPKYEEQVAIGRILEMADREIQILNGKLLHIKDQKKGLMQVLLTGKVRLQF